eukprot:UN02727
MIDSSPYAKVLSALGEVLGQALLHIQANFCWVPTLCQLSFLQCICPPHTVNIMQPAHATSLAFNLQNCIWTLLPPQRIDAATGTLADSCPGCNAFAQPYCIIPAFACPMMVQASPLPISIYDGELVAYGIDWRCKFASVRLRVGQKCYIGYHE